MFRRTHRRLGGRKRSLNGAERQREMQRARETKRARKSEGEIQAFKTQSETVMQRVSQVLFSQ